MGRTLRSGKQGPPVDLSRFLKDGSLRNRELQEKFANMHLTPSSQGKTNGVAAPLALPHELVQYIKKAVEIMKHMEENPDDKYDLTRLKCTESGINRIANYRKKSKDLPSDWKYDRATALTLLPREDSS